MMPFTSLNMVGLTGMGIGLPASCAKRGFGSKESTCETPPDMKQNMTFLIFGAKCGFFESDSAARPANAVKPKPVDVRNNISRRERKVFNMGLPKIQKLLEVKYGMRKILPGLLAGQKFCFFGAGRRQVSEARGNFFGGRAAAKRPPEHAVHPVSR